MKLLLDLGNSCCKYALLNSDGCMQYGTQNYEPFGKLYSIKSLRDKHNNLKKIIISSVLGEKMNTEIHETLTKDTSSDIFFLQSETNCFGVQLVYENPKEMGVDRVAGLIAANKHYSGTRCIIDCGTAITIDALDTHGMHLGGVIIPGAKAMRQGLLASTKIRIEEADMEADMEYELFAKSTATAVHSGCISAVVGGIEHVVNKMASDYEEFDHIILTGGGAEQLMNHMTMQVINEPTLVLDGLKIVAQTI